MPCVQYSRQCARWYVHTLPTNLSVVYAHTDTTKTTGECQKLRRLICTYSVAGTGIATTPERLSQPQAPTDTATALVLGEGPPQTDLTQSTHTAYVP
jgi:hypothetical protein